MSLGPMNTGGEMVVVVVVDGQDASALVSHASLFVDGIFELNHWRLSRSLSRSLALSLSRSLALSLSRSLARALSLSLSLSLYINKYIYNLTERQR